MTASGATNTALICARFSEPSEWANKSSATATWWSTRSRG
jgi:hypothetical protein